MEQRSNTSYITLHVSRKALDESIRDTEEFLEDVLSSLYFKKVVLDYFIPPQVPGAEQQDQVVTIRVDKNKLASLQTFLTQKKDQ